MTLDKLWLKKKKKKSCHSHWFYWQKYASLQACMSISFPTEPLLCLAQVNVDSIYFTIICGTELQYEN